MSRLVHWLPLRSICLSGLFVLGLTLSLTAQVPADPHRWALLIGVNGYAELNELHCAIADMRILRAHLLQGGFPAEHVILMEEHAGEAKLFPSKFNIEKQLEMITGLAEEGDIVVIGFSGHGLHVNGHSYICPIDAQSANFETFVSVDEIYGRLDESPATFKLCVFDACRSNPFKGGAKAAPPDTELAAFSKSIHKVPQGVVVLSSCDAGQVSFEDVDLGHGLFVYHLTEGLGGGADADHNSAVSLLEAFRYAAHETKLHAKNSYNHLQVPKLKGDVTEEVFEFPLAWLPRTPANVAQVPAAADAARQRAEALVEQEDYEHAVIAYGEALRLAPDDARLYLARGDVWYQLKKYDQANADYAMAQRAESDAVAAEAFASRAQVWHVTLDYARAIDDYREAIQRDPKHASSLNNLAWIYATCSEARYRDGGLAKEFAARACEATEWKDDGAIDTFAAALAEAGDFKKAEAYLQQPIALNPEKAQDVRATMLQCFQQRQPFRENVGATPTLAVSTETNVPTEPAELPDGVKKLLAEASQAYRAERYDEGVRLAEQALRICPPDSHDELATLFMLSHCQTALQNWDATLKALERIEVLLPKLPPRK